MISGILFSLMAIHAAGAGASPPAELPPAIILRGHRAAVFFLAFPRRDLLLSAAADGVRIWNPESGKPVKEIPGRDIISAAYSDAAGLLAVARADSSIIIYASGTWSETAALRDADGPALSMFFSRVNGLLAASGGDGKVRFWESTDWTLLPELAAHPGAFRLAGDSGSDSLLATYSNREPLLRLWDLRTKKLLYWLKSPHTLSAFFDPPGKRLASVSADRTLRVWEPGRMAASARLELAAGPMVAAAFSSSGGLLAAAGLDGSIAIWNSDSGLRSGEVNDSRARAQTVAFSPSGAYLASGETGGDIRVRLWTWEVWTSSGGVPVKNRGGKTIALLPAGIRLNLLKAAPGAEHWLVDDGTGLSGWVSAAALSAERPDILPPIIRISSQTYSAGVLSVKGAVSDDGRLDYVRFSGKALDRPADPVPFLQSESWPFEFSVELTPDTVPTVEAGDLSGKTSSLTLHLRTEAAAQPPAPRAQAVGDFTAENIPQGRVNPRGLAVVIGVKDYADRDIPRADYALEDAAAVRRHLISALGFEEDKVILLENPTKGQLETLFGGAGGGRLKKQITRGETELFVYYSGHGAADPEAGEAYLVPSDARPDYLRLGGFPLKQLYAGLEASGAAQVTVVIEACFSGLSHAGPLLSKANPLILTTHRPESKGLNIFSSSAADQVSSWYPAARRGLFTYYFLKALRENCCGAGPLRLETIKEITATEVPAAAMRLYGRTQTPLFTGDPQVTLSK